MINYNNIKQINGWCSDEKIDKMIKLILDKKPTNIVEIGVYCGKSLICQALALKENNIGKIYGIDSWDSSDCTEFEQNATALEWWSKLNLNDIYQDCLCNIQKNDVEKFVQICKMKSSEFINNIDFEIDILHIDGNHNEISACRDVNLYLPKIKKGGYIWFDDALWTTTQSAIKLMETEHNCVLIDKAYWEDKFNYCSLYQKQ